MIGPEKSARQACAKTILFLQSLTGRDIPAYLVSEARTLARQLTMAFPPDAPLPKARPIFVTLGSALHFAAAALLIVAGSMGVSMHVPAFGVWAMGTIWLFPALASAALAWQHWRLKEALKALAKARGAYD